MSLSLDDLRHEGSSSQSEMRQTKSAGLVDPLMHRPKVYYGEGPFDPPSSDEEERPEDEGEDDTDVETLSLLTIDKSAPSTPGRAERGEPSPRRSAQQEQKHSNVRLLGFFLAGLVSLAAVIGIIAGFLYSGKAFRTPGTRRITMDHVFNGTFSSQFVSVDWVAEAGDGVFSVAQDSHINLVDLKTNTTTSLVSRYDILTSHGDIMAINSWKLSDDMKYLLIKTDHLKQWRWSSFGNYYIHNIAEKTTYPITQPSQPPKTAFATWAPLGSAIAYVKENDLYVLPSARTDVKPIRITTSGNASLFHGVPDWVYEEEIFSADHALWWSPDAKKVAFLAFDETTVPEYTFPIYNPTDNSFAIIPYTSDVVMKYPKPGYPNPLVTVHIFDLGRYLEDSGDDEFDFPVEQHTLTLDWDGRQSVDNSIILEVAWVGNSSLILKEVNRNADEGVVVSFDLDAPTSLARATGKVVRKLGKDGEEHDDGWIDNDQTIFPIPSTLAGFTDTSAYLDIVPTAEGYNHIALFNPADSGTPQFLTSGAWEVLGKIQGVDAKKGLVYFVAGNPSSVERHVYSVSIPTSSSEKVQEAKALTPASKPSFYSTKFSPEAGFYVLNYQGPGVPWSKVINTANASFEHVLTLNERLSNATQEYESATIQHSTISNDGYEFNVVELRPPRMDDSGRTKYPVLFRVYGGPNSQMVDLRFARDWHHYLACSLGYVVVTVDGRGTGARGRKLRNPVKNNLGFYETLDQIAAAKEWAKKPYVDPKRIGIWGWSYGGFMTSKVVEANAKVHSLAMAVAPVTSWRLYDSIYTERYMNLPAENPNGYINASITNVEGFKNVSFLLAHGSGDDNVHFANSAHLLDMFTAGSVRGFRFRMFTDSDHSINRRGASREIYEYLTSFLIEKWGKGGRRRM